MKMDFLCIGPQRTGTSWLDCMLRQHPEILLPRHVKETFFWDKRYERGIKWYRRHFPKDTSGRRLGEIAPTLFSVDSARIRLQQSVPDCRILVCLRHPVQRAISHYRHELALGLQRGNLQEAAHKDPRIIEASRYSLYLPKWRKDFGDDRVLCLRQEEMRLHPAQLLARVCQLLEINSDFHPQEESQNISETVSVTRPRLAHFAYKSASLLRSLGADFMVEKSKRWFPRSLFWQKAKFPKEIQDQDLNFLKRELSGEIIEWEKASRYKS